MNAFIEGRKRSIYLPFNVRLKQKRKKQGARKSDHSVSDYLGALVGDFIRGKKLQKEEMEQREKNESEEILASLVSQQTNVILPIKQHKTKTRSWKETSRGRGNTKQQEASGRRVDTRGQAGAGHG